MPYALEAHSVASKIGMNGQSALLQSPTGTRSLTTPVAGVGPPPLVIISKAPRPICAFELGEEGRRNGAPAYANANSPTRSGTREREPTTTTTTCALLVIFEHAHASAPGSMRPAGSSMMTMIVTTGTA